jgi:hypothetical protein
MDQFLSPISSQIPEEIGTFESSIPLPPVPRHRFSQDYLIAFNPHRQAVTFAQPQPLSNFFGED